MRLLLLSNSTNPGEDYLGYTLPYISDYIHETPSRAVFIPYAGVSITWDEYFKLVAAKLEPTGIRISSVHHSNDPLKSILQSDLIIIGGGNTFNLLKSLQDLNLIGAIRERVIAGVPYIGWSAGSNIACPTIKTTNDMPIVETSGFDALGLLPFQINPHYTDEKIEGHGGESRDMRLAEFLIANQGIYVAGLREGTMFLVNDNNIALRGNKPCKVFIAGKEPIEYNSGDDFSFLMQ